MWWHSFINPSIWDNEAGGLHKLEASLGYEMSSSPTQFGIQSETLSQT